MATLRFIYDAPRWAKVGQALRDRAWIEGLEIDVQSETGWITEHGRVYVSGESEKVAGFATDIEWALRKFNGGDP